MIVKLILGVLLVMVVNRIVRGLLFRRSPAQAPPRARGRKLDPDRAVSARWSEVSEEKGDARD